ncbi:DUF2782 domain-containing protein [Endozoicomonas sp. SCSIO W0465]|uniref:DUF2782 domain-containing protein n=1 Tax=Endozoicomonas sp. SCSIO W0465 TaxID=2918516 RepID=UPI002075FB1C|nr:DUF2782 domain-containing protein [Endozoicomonas sp. SCSIO W0465]USE36634.1 DUF2782 domain-containing protein [Endozoicomonas sp. SCSIO W0465]
MKLFMKMKVAIKRAPLGLAFFPLLLVGCATHSPEGSEPSTVSSHSSGNQKALVFTNEAIKKIPKHLRPEALESRDDTSVVIRAGDSRTYKEYRVGGQLYAIQVIPKIGKPYYLIASDNEGNPIDPTKRTLLVPSWTIFEWH